MRILSSALKHGILPAAIQHAIKHPVDTRRIRYDDEDRLLIIGSLPDGQLIEIVAVPADAPERIIHANYLNPKWLAGLRR